jgi:hypothetical protein
MRKLWGGWKCYKFCHKTNSQRARYSVIALLIEVELYIYIENLKWLHWTQYELLAIMVMWDESNEMEIYKLKVTHCTMYITDRLYIYIGGYICWVFRWPCFKQFITNITRISYGRLHIWIQCLMMFPIVISCKHFIAFDTCKLYMTPITLQHYSILNSI